MRKERIMELYKGRKTMTYIYALVDLKSDIENDIRYIGYTSEYNWPRLQAKLFYRTEANAKRLDKYREMSRNPNAILPKLTEKDKWFLTHMSNDGEIGKIWIKRLETIISDGSEIMEQTLTRKEYWINYGLEQGWNLLNVNLVKKELPESQPKKRTNISTRLRFEILKRDNYKCQLCGKSTAEDNVKLEIDHKIAWSKGGSNERSNLWTLCFECNNGKRDKELIAQ
jgi:hypothetical protein